MIVRPNQTIRDSFKAFAPSLIPLKKEKMKVNTDTTTSKVIHPWGSGSLVKIKASARLPDIRATVNAIAALLARSKSN